MRRNCAVVREGKRNRVAQNKDALRKKHVEVNQVQRKATRRASVRPCFHGTEFEGVLRMILSCPQNDQGYSLGIVGYFLARIPTPSSSRMPTPNRIVVPDSDLGGPNRHKQGHFRATW
eukprot:130478-Rhodomonas_salina.2